MSDSPAPPMPATAPPHRAGRANGSGDTTRFGFVRELDAAAAGELLRALEHGDSFVELLRLVALRHADLVPPPLADDADDGRHTFAHVGDQMVDAQYSMAHDAARRCVGVYHRMGLIPTPDMVASRMTKAQRLFFLERTEQGCIDQLLIVPQLDDRVVPLSMLLDGYTTLRRSIPIDAESAETPQRFAQLDEKQYVVEKGLWNRANFNQSHNPEYATAGEKEPIWRVLVLLGDVQDPLDPAAPAHPAGERGLVHNFSDPRAMKRAFEKERLALEHRDVKLDELSIAGYVLANTILSMLGQHTLDNAHNTATLFTYYKNLKREAGADLYPVVYTRNGRIYLDETPSTSRARVRPVGVRRVVQII